MFKLDNLSCCSSNSFGIRGLWSGFVELIGCSKSKMENSSQRVALESGFGSRTREKNWFHFVESGTMPSSSSPSNSCITWLELSQKARRQGFSASLQLGFMSLRRARPADQISLCWFACLPGALTCSGEIKLIFVGNNDAPPRAKPPFVNKFTGQWANFSFRFDDQAKLSIVMSPWTQFTTWWRWNKAFKSCSAVSCRSRLSGGCLFRFSNTRVTRSGHDRGVLIRISSVYQWIFCNLFSGEPTYHSCF